jgi:hypothetical protein
MNRFKTLLITCCVCLVAAGTAHAQFFGQMGPLGGMASGHALLGAYMTAGSGDLGFVAELRGSSGSQSTVGLAATVEHSMFGMQADLRGSLTGTGGSFPLALGGQLAAGLITGGGSTGIYAQAVPGVSFESSTNGQGTFSSWAGIGLRLTAASHQSGMGDGVLRLGSRYSFSPTLGISATLEDVGGTTKIIAGAGYTF